MKTFFDLPSYYEGLKARRMAQSGRLWLCKVINDPPPYFLVMIRGFDREKDAQTGARSIGSWRFQGEVEARAKFDELTRFFPNKIKEPSLKQLAARKAFAERMATGKK